MIKNLIIYFSISFSLYSNQMIIYDSYFSPYSGASDLFFAESSLIEVRDSFASTYSRNSTAKVFLRALEQIFIWELVNIFTSVTQHEVFGHGYRLRELGEKVCGYTLGIDGGATYFDVDESFKVGKMLAVVVAGLEAEAIFARDIKMNWIQKGCIDGRQSSLYTQCEQSLFFYTLITNLGKLEADEVLEGNDVDGYMNLLNASYTDSNVNIGDLTRISLVNWVDPMTFYAYFSWFYYIAEGKSWAFPMISLTDKIKYLPNARIGYAPYGTEGYFENFFSVDGKPLYCYFKGGKRSLGFGAAYDYLFSNEKGSVGLCFDCWKQNQFLTSATIGQIEEGQNGQIKEGQKLLNPDSSNKVWGLSASITSTYFFSRKIGIYTQIGGKTKGYLPGYSLDSDIVWRLGLSFKS